MTPVALLMLPLALLAVSVAEASGHGALQGTTGTLAAGRTAAYQAHTRPVGGHAQLEQTKSLRRATALPMVGTQEPSVWDVARPPFHWLLAAPLAVWGLVLLLRRRAPTVHHAMAALTGKSRSLALYASGDSDAGSGELSPFVLQPKTAAGRALEQALTTSPEAFAGAAEAEEVKLCEAKARAAAAAPRATALLSLGPANVASQQQAVGEVVFFTVVSAFVKAGLRPIGRRQVTGSAKFAAGDTDRLLTLLRPEELEAAKAHVAEAARAVAGKDGAAEDTVQAREVQLFQMFRSAIGYGYFLRNCSVQAQENDMPTEEVQAFFAEFEGSAMIEFARSATVEAARAVQDYLNAVFDDVPALMQQLQSPDETSSSGPSPDLLELTFGDLQGVVLEGVVFGAAVREAETSIEEAAPAPLLSHMF